MKMINSKQSNTLRRALETTAALFPNYVAWTVLKVHRRMLGLRTGINNLTSELEMAQQNFRPFLNFLKMTFIVIIIATCVVVFGMYNYHSNASVS